MRQYVPPGCGRTLDAASEGMLVTDHRGNIILVNRAYTEITGYRADEVIGMNPRVLRSGRHDEAFYDAMWSAFAPRWAMARGEIWNKRRDGEIYPSWLGISSIKDTSGRIANFLASSPPTSASSRHSSNSPTWPTMIR